ncbi:uncharacterized protein [Coffea arabica]|uniref:RNase H type-1 domain-containing protein n=1 Tax=Coffea arabica TaxID=13443 RepID=A0ABM4VCJ2_COFAR
MGAARLFKPAHFRGDQDCSWASLPVSASTSIRLSSISWRKPPRDAVKLNTDASVVASCATGEGLLRTFEGKLVFAFYKEFGDVDVLMAEALALVAGLQCCRYRNFKQILVEADSCSLVCLVNSDKVAKWPACQVVRHVRVLLQDLNSTLSPVFRETNSAADALATA